MHVTQFCHKQYSFETLSLLRRQKVPNSFAYYRLVVSDYPEEGQRNLVVQIYGH